MLLTRVTNIPFKYHIAIALVIRLLVILYGELQDKYAEVPFTDIDYRVVTDGARHISNNRSPFERNTYRYTPLLAYLLLPNIFFREWFGKVLFCVFDILIAFVIKNCLIDEFEMTFRTTALSILKKNKQLKILPEQDKFKLPLKYQHISITAALSWLYNPMSVVISTRGNGDSISTFLILISIYFLQKVSINQKNSLLFVVLCGIAHGLAIHFRLYPIAFSLAYYLYLTENGKHFWYTAIFKPNKKQLYLILSTVLTLLFFTSMFYAKYGYKFLFEAYIYHLVRKDTRHNFSLYFYMHLLNTKPFFIEKLLTFVPQMIILLLINVYFGWHRKTLSFCIFLQSFVIVTFNPVLTSQYFIWYFAILPLCLKNLKTIGVRKAIFYGVLWIGVQSVWLYSAYLLEFKGWNTFDFIWMQGTLFFCMNGLILKTIINHFDVITDI